MARNFLVFFLIVFSSVVIIFGGYNCAQKIPLGQGDVDRIPTDGSLGDGDPGDKDPDDDSGLPEEKPSRCNSSEYRELRKSGAFAYIDLNYRHLRDFLRGQESNYELGCPQILLNMEQITDSSQSSPTYEGAFYIAYDSGQGFVWRHAYDSGNTVKDNKFNTWRGNWRVPNVNFAAIFENSRTAIILRITKVRRVDDSDGEAVYRGSGTVWFKMFRVFSEKGDICHTKGGYVAFARPGHKPDLPTKRCWFLDIGPYSCLPKGTGTIKSFNLRGDLTCYKKLGEFERLDIEEAFNFKVQEAFSEDFAEEE